MFQNVVNLAHTGADCCTLNSPFVYASLASRCYMQAAHSSLLGCSSCMGTAACPNATGIQVQEKSPECRQCAFKDTLPHLHACHIRTNPCSHRVFLELNGQPVFSICQR